mmetsp:Transcript_52717/g.138622  ORF Transcript_52717/g.138622 Transcript_52717/m.138622 type:complete len:211 (-) Transcript_52717:116-748(-)
MHLPLALLCVLCALWGPLLPLKGALHAANVEWACLIRPQGHLFAAGVQLVNTALVQELLRALIAALERFPLDLGSCRVPTVALGHIPPCQAWLSASSAPLHHSPTTQARQCAVTALLARMGHPLEPLSAYNALLDCLVLCQGSSNATCVEVDSSAQVQAPPPALLVWLGLSLTAQHPLCAAFAKLEPTPQPKHPQCAACAALAPTPRSKA